MMTYERDESSLTENMSNEGKQDIYEMSEWFSYALEKYAKKDPENHAYIIDSDDIQDRIVWYLRSCGFNGDEELQMTDELLDLIEG